VHTKKERSVQGKKMCTKNEGSVSEKGEGAYTIKGRVYSIHEKGGLCTKKEMECTKMGIKGMERRTI